MIALAARFWRRKVLWAILLAAACGWAASPAKADIDSGTAHFEVKSPSTFLPKGSFLNKVGATRRLLNFLSLGSGSGKPTASPCG